MGTIYYLAYGSNLHPLRITERAASGKLLGVLQMPGYALAFHKRSTDKSGKCLFYQTKNLENEIHCALFSLSETDKDELDNLEGLGHGYFEQSVTVTVDGNTYRSSIYAAQPDFVDSSLQPYDWYKGLVLAGARYHRFPDAYVQKIDAIPSISDPDANRARKREDLLRRMNEV